MFKLGLRYKIFAVATYVISLHTFAGCHGLLV